MLDDVFQQLFPFVTVEEVGPVYCYEDLLDLVKTCAFNYMQLEGIIQDVIDNVAGKLPD